ncbi:Two-component response regulator SSK1p [Rhodotorula kratochvilovae]
MAPDESAAAAEQLAPPAAPAPRTRRTPSRRSLAGPSASNTPPPQPGTFLTRFLGTFRPPAASSPARPNLPRSLSSPILSPSAQGANPDLEPQPPTPGPSSSTLAIPGGFPAPSPTPPSPSNSFARRLRPSFRRRASGGISQQSSPSGSPASSPGLSGALSDGGTLSPSSPATLRGGAERDPMDAAFGRGDGERRGSGTRRGSIMSQVTVQAHDHAYASGAPSTPLEPIDEPDPNPKPRLDQSLELIATLLPPALLLLSQLGPTHLFSPPVQLPALFEATLAASATRKSSISSATGSNALLSSSASIASTATGSTTSASTSFFSGLPITDHLIPTHSHELHAPSTLSVPAVSAGAIWRLFRGFEWVGEVGRGAQPLPHSPLPPHLGGQGGGPPLDPEDDPEQVFDFPSLLQGVADVLAADAAARGIELVVGQVGSGSAPSPVTTPDAATDLGKGKGPAVPAPSEGLPHARPAKDSETRELLVRADERAWSVTLIWILHHILAGASSGCTIDVRFLATAATPPPSPTPSRASSPEPDARPYPPTFSPSRPQKWWNVSLEILLTAPPLPPPPPFIDETAATSMPPSLAAPPFDTPFAKSLFSLVQLHMVPSLQGDATSRSWALEALLPAARPKTQSITDDPSTLLGRRRASIDTTVGQEPSMNDLKRFAETALKGHRVALHAGETSAFAKHLTTYLAGWGMDVQHIPIEHESLSSGSTAVSGPDKTRVTVGAGSRFDSGFETAATSPAATAADIKPPELGAMGEGTSSLVIIDDDISTLRRLLVSLRAPPLHVAPGLMGKRPQLATRRTRSSPHVRQLHQVQQGLSHAQQASQWVIVHFASLTHYKAIKEIVQDTLATSKSASIPEVLVVPKPAGPRRIITAIWTALKRPAVDPSLAPIATSPTSPGIQYWTPRLSPALAKDHDFDFGGSDPGSSKSDPTAGGSTLGKPRTPPIYGSTNGNGGSAMPPSPLGRIDDNEDSYFSTVTEELKDASTSEGMIVQSPDGRSGIFFQPQPRNARNSLDKQRRQNTAERERRASLHRGTLEEAIELPASRAPSEPPSIPLSRAMSTAAPASEILSPPGSAPPSTPALTLDSFITAAKSRANGEDISPEELPPANGGSASPLAEGLQRQMSIAASARGTPTRRSLSGSSGSAASAGGGGQASVAPSPRGMGGAQSPLYSPRRGTSSGSASPVVAPSPAPSNGGAPAAAAGAAAAKALAQSQQSAPSKVRSRSGTIPALPKNRRRSSRKGTLPAVPPISVLIVEDNPINQTILSMFMKKKGISYKVAKDGEQAVQMWKKGNFHLVLMDIQLPVKDGIEATREIRELERQNNIGTFITTPTSDITSPMSSASGNNPFSTPSSPLLNMPVIIVALTASSLQADRVAALAAGCNDFLTKPVSLVWLESKLVEWGSMAYLSGFSRKAVEASDASATSSTRASTPSRPTSPVAKPKPSAEFKETAANRADNISQHLHIERPTSRANSPSNGHRSALASIAGSPSNSPEASPPTGAEGGQQPISSAAVARALNPSFTLTSPTPDVTPGPVPAIPGAVATPAPAAGGDAKETLDRVEEKLEGLIQEQEELGTTGAGEAPQRPGPTPLPPSVVTAGDPLLDSVVAESQRLIRAGRGRANSASFGQAMAESGVSSSSSSAAPSAQNSANDIRKIPPPRD